MHRNQQNNHGSRVAQHIKQIISQRIKKSVSKAALKILSGAIKKIGATLIAKFGPIIAVVAIVIFLCVAIVSLFSPEFGFGDKENEDGKVIEWTRFATDEEITQRLRDYVTLASGLHMYTEWLMALDMTTYENVNLMDYNINENAYHFVGIDYVEYIPGPVECDENGENCVQLPDIIIEEINAKGKDQVQSLFIEKDQGDKLDDILAAIAGIRARPLPDGVMLRMDVFNIGLDAAAEDAKLTEEETEYFKSVVEIDLIKEFYEEYGLSTEWYALSSYYGSKAYCSPTKEVDKATLKNTLQGAGAFYGYEDTFIRIAEKQGIDPILFIAIALHETGHGKSSAVLQKNNPGGLMDPSTGSKRLYIFPTLEEGLEAMGKTLHNRIIKDGLTTIDALGNVYAPVGAANDPNGLNKHWVSNVSAMATKLGGLTVNCEAYDGQSIGFEGNVSDAAKKIASAGLKWIGNSRYVFGGGRTQSDINKGNFDCSSFVHWAYLQAGINLGNLSSTSTETLNKMGRQVSISDIQVGDIIFWNTYKKDGHVGIYIGNGKFIGAQSSTGVAIESIDSAYWKSVFSGHVRRLLN